MVDNYNQLVEKLYKVEGGKIHKNKNELDITSSCGIYKYQHKDAKVFKYIDQIADAIGITKPSSQWTQLDIDSVNAHIDKDIELAYSIEFYKDYIKVIDLNKLPKEMVWPFFNIYINSNKIAGKALQYSSNQMIKSNSKLFNPKDLKPLSVDGIIGNGSREMIYSISEIINFIPQSELYGEMWKLYFVNRCKTEYVSIGTNDVAKTGTDKDIIYLKGWINRCDALLEEDV